MTEEVVQLKIQSNVSSKRYNKQRDSDMRNGGEPEHYTMTTDLLDI